MVSRQGNSRISINIFIFVFQFKKWCSQYKEGKQHSAYGIRQEHGSSAYKNLLNLFCLMVNSRRIFMYKLKMQTTMSELLCSQRSVVTIWSHGHHHSFRGRRARTFCIFIITAPDHRNRSKGSFCKNQPQFRADHTTYTLTRVAL